MRESVAAENVPGGFSAVYDVLKALEESGRIRRGYFVAGLGATQFALAGGGGPAAPVAHRARSGEAGIRATGGGRSRQSLRLGSALAGIAGGGRGCRVRSAGAHARRLRRSDLVQWKADRVAAAQQSQRADFPACRGAGANADCGGAGPLSLDARTGTDAWRQPRGRAGHDHQRPAGRRASHGATS